MTALSPDGLDPVSLHLAEVDPGAFVQRLGAAFERHGFAVVADHGLDPALIEATLADARALFGQPEADKRRYQVAGGAGQRGYTPFGLESAKGRADRDLKEFWHVGREPAPPGCALPPNVWPQAPATFRRHALSLYAAMDALAARLLGAVAIWLGLPADGLDAAIAGGDSLLRLLHYPPGAFDGPSIRAGAHEDIDVLTLLLGAEEAGLQILEPEGCWRSIDPPPDALVVNIGDMLARLTNDRLPSTTHRVVNPQAGRRGVARWSMPFFLHFRPDYVIETLPSCIGPDRPDRYPDRITAGALLRRRLAEIGLA